MRSPTILAPLVAALLALPAAAASSTDFESVLEPYEAIRVALVQDDLEGAREPAEVLRTAIRQIREDPTTESAGVPAERLREIEALLPELATAAAELTGAADLQEARDAFYALSKPLVRWRQAAGDGPAVVYCAMKKRSWLQSAEGGVGNPYYGQEMASCGEVVSQ